MLIFHILLEKNYTKAPVWELTDGVLRPQKAGTGTVPVFCCFSALLEVFLFRGFSRFGLPGFAGGH
jgi:hypothetical protein